MNSTTGLVTNTRRLERYVRGSAYVLLAFEPLAVILYSANQLPWPVGLAMLAQGLSSIAVGRWVLTALRDRPLRPGPRLRLALVGWAVLSVAALAGVVATLVPSPDDAGPWLRGLASLLLVLATPLSAVAALIRPRWLILSCLAVGALGFGALRLRTGLGLADAVSSAVWLATATAFFAFTFWATGWMLRVIWALEDARTVAAELAIAEERLRISRDLHDLFGRTLAAVAVKSELAAELIRRDRYDAAAGEIQAVRGLADDAGREVREVVRGYRAADLDTEVAGARSLLESTGIRCSARKAGLEDVPIATAATLAWVLREAVTNVLRHSRATECLIRLDGPDPVRLVVTNNGSVEGSADHRGAGSGLLGMAERLDGLGGRLNHRRDGDRFTVEAVLPGRHELSGAGA